MATITNTTDRDTLAGAIIATWTAMGNADTGTAISVPYAAEITFQVSGTFGGATVVLEGSNDGTNWSTLGAMVGTNCSLTSAGIRKASENPVFVRAKTSGGTGTAVVATVALHARYAKAPY